MLATSEPPIAIVAAKDKPFHKVKNFTPMIAGGDSVSALCTASLAAINVAIIDRAIMLKAMEQTTSIWEGVVLGYKTMFLTPKKFFFRTDPPNHFAPIYRLVTLVYGGTYMAGNLTQSYCEANSYSYLFPKFVNGSAANVLLTLYKDNQMLKILGSDKPTPKLSLGLFILRDSLTVFSSFYLSEVVAKKVKQTWPELTPRQCSDLGDVMTPAAIQFISTPIHLFAIMYKQFPELRKTPDVIWRKVLPQYLPAAFSRVGRIVPAFGIGMMVNRRLRNKFGDAIEGPQ
jgi:hypothetical protein